METNKRYEVTFKVPGEPTGKGRPRVVKSGAFARTYTPEKTATYENLVKLEYQRQCGKTYFGEAPLGMRIRAYHGIPKAVSKRKRAAMIDKVIRPVKKPDIDNIEKVIGDALNGLAYRDDVQIVSHDTQKYFAVVPCVEVTIWEE